MVSKSIGFGAKWMKFGCDDVVSPEFGCADFAPPRVLFAVIEEEAELENGFEDEDDNDKSRGLAPAVGAIDGRYRDFFLRTIL
mmetsp:Transcript_19205/g.53511  ORF Transcript_19205/g.53511 Transcript_19205/m.53511 type:complete len:83 (+) Transcript_19205:428-676(+)